MTDKRPKKKPIVVESPAADTNRIFSELRTRFDHLAQIEPDALEAPPQLHILQANYALGKASEAALGDSAAQCRRWGLELAQHALSLVASIDARDAGEDEAE